MPRAMLDHAQLPPAFWAEAIATATELHNMTATSNNNGRTPLEVLTGRKPNVKLLRIFAIEAWMHVPRNFRKRLHANEKRGIVLRSLAYGK